MILDVAPNAPCGFCGKILMWSIGGSLVHTDMTPICQSTDYLKPVNESNRMATSEMQAQARAGQRDSQ